MCEVGPIPTKLFSGLAIKGLSQEVGERNPLKKIWVNKITKNAAIPSCKPIRHFPDKLNFPLKLNRTANLQINKTTTHVFSGTENIVRIKGR